MTDDLLPLNASAQERAVSLAVKRAGEVPVGIDSLWNPWTCPASALPWLAWALHVDNWDTGWTETQKRQVIAASFNVHRVKGTVGAVKRVADSFGLGVVIKEWFQTTPQGSPHTFSVYFTIPNVSVDQQNSILSAIADVKPVRSQMVVSVTESAVCNATIPAFVQPVSFTRFQASLN